MKHEDILEAINNLVPQAKFVLSGEDYAGINWVDERPQPTLQQIEAEIILFDKKKLEEAKQKEETRKSALAKLAALGLTPEEIAAL